MLRKSSGTLISLVPSRNNLCAAENGFLGSSLIASAASAVAPSRIEFFVAAGRDNMGVVSEIEGTGPKGHMP